MRIIRVSYRQLIFGQSARIDEPMDDCSRDPDPIVCAYALTVKIDPNRFEFLLIGKFQLGCWIGKPKALDFGHRFYVYDLYNVSSI